MVTAKGEEADVVTGLELGADDYLTKPFSPKVLIARLRAVIRRREQEGAKDAKEPIQRGDLLIHPGRREVLVSGSRVALELTFTEFNILALLASRPGWVFTRAQIVDTVRGYDYHVTERSVDVHVVGLRRKLGTHGELIETVRGVGYRFREV
jgi:two-component system alkaline phosphatase synthesis response regulator PhoP